MNSPVTGQLAGLAGHGVGQRDRGELVVAVQRGDRAVPHQLELRVGEGAVLHDLRGAQLVAAVDEVDLLGEAGEERGLLDRGVAAADDRDLLVAEEEPVAGRAPRDAVTGQPVLVGDVRACGSRTRSPGSPCARGARCPSPSVTFLISPVRSTAVTSSVTSSAPKRSACARISSMSSGPMMPSRKPGKFSTSVVFISAPPAVTAPSKTSGLQVGPGGVDRGGVAGGAGADDDDLADVGGHGSPSRDDGRDCSGQQILGALAFPRPWPEGPGRRRRTGQGRSTVLSRRSVGAVAAEHPGPDAPPSRRRVRRTRVAGFAVVAHGRTRSSRRRRRRGGAAAACLTGARRARSPGRAVRLAPRRRPRVAACGPTQPAPPAASSTARQSSARQRAGRVQGAPGSARGRRRPRRRPWTAAGLRPCAVGDAGARPAAVALAAGHGPGHRGADAVAARRRPRRRRGAPSATAGGVRRAG